MLKYSKIICLLVIFIFLPSSYSTLFHVQAELITEKGTAVINAVDLPNLLGTPENSVRFALWNGSSWFELPFSVNDTSAQNVTVIAPSLSNSSSEKSCVSPSSSISESNVFSILIPDSVGVAASSDEWWVTAVDLGLTDRFLIALSGDGYSDLIYVYYQPNFTTFKPDYTSFYILPGFQFPVTNGTTISDIYSLYSVNFSLQSVSDPEVYSDTQSMESSMSPDDSSTQDPPLFSNQNILKETISDSNPYPTSEFYLPEQCQEACLIVDTITSDQSPRDINIKVNGNSVFNGEVLGNFTNSFLLTSNIHSWGPQNGPFVYNTASVTLTNYGGIPWEIDASILCNYQASDYFNYVNSTWAQYYEIPKGTQGITPFYATLPDSDVDATGAQVIHICYYNNGDNVPRSLFLYCEDSNGNWNLLDSWTVSGVSSVSFDLSNYVYSELMGSSAINSITVGLSLNSPVANWGFDGYITTLMRPAVAPDDSPFWNYDQYVHTIDSGTIYHTWDWNGNSMSSTFGTYSTETLCNDYPNVSNPNFITDVTVIPYVDGDYSDCSVQSINTKITVTEQNGDQISGLYSEAYGSCNGVPIGGTYANGNIGLLELNLAGIGASLANPYLGAFESSVQDIAQFAFGQNTGLAGGGFTCKSDSAGYSMQYVPPIPDLNPCDEPISILLSYDPEIGDIGTCTISITTSITLSGYSSWPYCWPGQSSINFTDTFTHYYGPSPPDPPISVDCSASLYPIAETAAISFPSYYNSLGLDSSINHVNVDIDSDGGVYAGVMDGTYDVGFVDRLPNQGEYNSSTQLYAVGYNGSYTSQNFTLSNVIWMVSDGTIKDGCPQISIGSPQMAAGVFVSYVRAYAKTLLPTGFTALNPSDYGGNTFSGTGQLLPDGQVPGSELFYFVEQYINYYSSNEYNPLCDISCKGTIDSSDFFQFIAGYISYWNTQYTQSQQFMSGGATLALEGDNSSTAGVLSAVQQGTTNSAWSVGPSPNPINSTVDVDIRVDNASNIWGWTIPNITWNASVLQLTKVVEGSFLSDNTGGDSATMVGDSSGLFNNTIGTINGGLAEAIEGNDLSTDSSGVLATLYFNVTGSGVADINLSGATLYANSTDTVGTAITANNATVNVIVPEYITASASAGSTISPSGTINVDSGSNQTFTISAKTGYQIANVAVDGQSQGPILSYTFYNVNANHTITVTSQIDTYPITATSDSNSEISPSGTTYVDYGASQTYTIAANPGYTIANVTVDGVAQGPIASYTFTDVQAAHSISVTSTQETFTSGNHPIGSWTQSYPAESMCQNPVFYADGLWWFFGKDSSGNMAYWTYNGTGTSWSSETRISLPASGYFDMYSNGTDVAYVCCSGSADTPLYYRLGTLSSSGTINWLQSGAQTAIAAAASTTYLDPTVTLDAKGSPWIGYVSGASTYSYMLTESSSKTGTWTTAWGYPTTVDGAATVPEYSLNTIVPLYSSGTVYIMAVFTTSTTNPETYKWELWSGYAWFGGTISTTVHSGGYFDCQSYGSYAYFAYVDYTPSLYASSSLLFTSFSCWSCAWSSTTTLSQTNISLDASPVQIAVNPSNGAVLVTWEDSAYNVNYDIYQNGSWSGATVWFNDPNLASNYDFMGLAFSSSTNMAVVTYLPAPYNSGDESNTPWWYFATGNFTPQ